jgi:hypothetical protein
MATHKVHFPGCERQNHPIVIQPDAPALLAQRLVQRLQRDGFFARDEARRVGRDAVMSKALWRAHVDALTEALADEIHQATVDGTLGGAP